ncbi:hypothetical protein [Neisseria musculi]|uniref:Uncharacterized protein n=1 Tax=Neisseria musculi TaxID=1815583 RepID=A0A7H1MCL1_9NEIS|nr:hypothetical protein [Neisseria musculi]QNT59376.1 hypothetical protein H7A79_0721 [Neisseria musculi]
MNVFKLTRVQEAYGRDYRQAYPIIGEICAHDLQRRCELIEEREKMIGEIGEHMSSVFYERMDSYLIRRDTVCGSDLDALLEKIEKFLGVPPV